MIEDMNHRMAPAPGWFDKNNLVVVSRTSSWVITPLWVRSNTLNYERDTLRMRIVRTQWGCSVCSWRGRCQSCIWLGLVVGVLRWCRRG